MIDAHDHLDGSPDQPIRPPMTPDPAVTDDALYALASIADPLGRQELALARLEDARDEWKRQARHWSRVRANAVQELKAGRTWAQVAELLGVSEATAWNIAHPKG